MSKTQKLPIVGKIYTVIHILLYIVYTLHIQSLYIYNLEEKMSYILFFTQFV
jgi:hypothetical protein